MTAAASPGGRSRPADDDWLTTAEAATLAGVKPDTLRHYARTGHAPTPRAFGRSLQWSRREVLEWLATRPGRGTRTDLRPNNLTP